MDDPAAFARSGASACTGILAVDPAAPATCADCNDFDCPHVRRNCVSLSSRSSIEYLHRFEGVDVGSPYLKSGSSRGKARGPDSKRLCRCCSPVHQL